MPAHRIVSLHDRFRPASTERLSGLPNTMNVPPVITAAAGGLPSRWSVVRRRVIVGAGRRVSRGSSRDADCRTGCDTGPGVTWGYDSRSAIIGTVVAAVCAVVIAAVVGAVIASVGGAAIAVGGRPRAAAARGGAAIGAVRRPRPATAGGGAAIAIGGTPRPVAAGKRAAKC